MTPEYIYLVVDELGVLMATWDKERADIKARNRGAVIGVIPIEISYFDPLDTDIPVE